MEDKKTEIEKILETCGGAGKCKECTLTILENGMASCTPTYTEEIDISEEN